MASSRQVATRSQRGRWKIFNVPEEPVGARHLQ